MEAVRAELDRTGWREIAYGRAAEFYAGFAGLYASRLSEKGRGSKPAPAAPAV